MQTWGCLSAHGVFTVCLIKLKMKVTFNPNTTECENVNLHADKSIYKCLECMSSQFQIKAAHSTSLRFKVGAAKRREDFKRPKTGTSAIFKQSVTFPNVVGPAERLLPDVGISAGPAVYSLCLWLPGLVYKSCQTRTWPDWCHDCACGPSLPGWCHVASMVYHGGIAVPGQRRKERWDRKNAAVQMPDESPVVQFITFSEIHWCMMASTWKKGFQL